MLVSVVLMMGMLVSMVLLVVVVFWLAFTGRVA